MVRVTLQERSGEEEDGSEAVYEVDVYRDKVRELIPGTRSHKIGGTEFYLDSKLEYLKEEEGFETEYEGDHVFQGMYATKKPFTIRVQFDEDVDEEYREEFREKLEGRIQRWAEKWNMGMNPVKGLVDEE